MPIFEVYNEDGSLQMNLASRLTRVLGVLNVNLNAAGSHLDSRLKLGTPWYYVALPSGYNIVGFKNPVFTFNDNVMSWTGNPGGGTTMGQIAYGIYSNGSN